jgi:toluene monooxygenase system ferredoxin subunit
MGFKKICTVDDVWEGEMDVFDLDEHEVLIAHLPGGKVVAWQAVCPHQDIPLVEGKLEFGVLTCRAHLWQFDIETGCSINPTGCELAEYPVQLEGDDVLVDVDGIVPKYAAV